MSDLGVDAFSPREIAARVETVGVAKARMPLLTMLMLAMLAGAFIGLGAVGFMLVKSDASLGFAARQIVGDVVFSLGLTLVVIAGAELFTGNNLLAMAWADRKISTAELLRNWLVVCVGNLLGAVGLALLVYWSGHADMNQGHIAEAYVTAARAKVELNWGTAFVRGMLCNVLVCMAVWMVQAGRSVVDKLIVVVFPVSAFVAAGFEHSIANFFMIPMAMLLQHGGVVVGADTITLIDFVESQIPVIAGNIAGGSVLVGLVYYVIYLRPQRQQANKP